MDSVGWICDGHIWLYEKFNIIKICGFVSLSFPFGTQKIEKNVKSIFCNILKKKSICYKKINNILSF